MATTIEVNNLTLIAKGYMLELAEKMIDEQKKGCMDCADKISLQIQQLILLTEQLYAKVGLIGYDEEINRLYACLLSAVGNYSGASLTVDGNASVPNTTIVVEGGSGVTLPSWIDVNWSDMTNDVDGYRDTYFNADWVGYNPMIQIGGVVMYQVGIDYDNDGQGNIVFKAGKGLYEGQFFRAGNYQPYTSVPFSPTYTLINNSSFDTTYYTDGENKDLLVGDTITSPFTAFDSVIASIGVGQKATLTIYNQNNTVFSVLEQENPPTVQINTGLMDVTKRYEFIYTNN